MSRARLGTRTTAYALAVLLLVVTAWSATPPPAAAAVVSRTADQVTADALPTAQVDGVVWDQAVTADTVYAGGQFTAARPAGAAPGVGESSRGNLLAYDLATGVLDAGFRPSLNGAVNVLALSPDQTRLYVGGSFTTSDGSPRSRIAAYDVATGELVASFSPDLDATVKAIAVTGSTVYVGGLFSRANGNARSRLAAFDLDGNLLGWAPRASGPVNALLVAPGGTKLIVAGAFPTVNYTVAPGLAALDLSSAALLPWAANTVLRNSGTQAAMLSLTTDGSTVYGTGYSYSGAGNYEGAWAADPATGALTWLADCHGDTYDAAVLGGAVYTVSHHHQCANIGSFGEQTPRQHLRANAFTAAATGTVLRNTQWGYADFAGYGAPSQVNWFPDLKAGTFTGQVQAAWTVEAGQGYVVLGGEFPEVNGTAQQGLVRFAVPAKAPGKQGIRTGSAEGAPTLLPLSETAVRVAWKTSWDRDDDELTYEVLRNDQAAPVHTTTTRSLWWQRRNVSFVDRDLAPGTTYTYQVRVSDRDGNSSLSTKVTVRTGSGSGVLNAYPQAVLDDGATNYWRLNEPPGARRAPDWAGASDLTLRSGVTPGATGAVTDPADTAAAFDGSPLGVASTATAVPRPRTFSVEAWVKTRSTAGGKLLGFGDAAAGSSLNHDRHLYLDDAGRVTFGVYPGRVAVVRSSGTVNDGQWHHVVGTLSDAGLVLYVDGQRVAADPTVTSAQAYPGYWRVGGDRTSGWPNAGSTSYLAATIDEVAIYDVALTADQVRDHYRLAGRPTAPPPGPAVDLPARER